MQTFLLIFQHLIALVSEEEETSLGAEEDTTDGIASILLTLAQQISKLLNQDIDSLKFPKVIKK